MKIDGGCHCGFITYEAEADRADDHLPLYGLSDADRLGVPHDRSGGSGGISASLRRTEGLSEDYRREWPEARAGVLPRVRDADLRAAAEDEPKSYGIRVGTMRQRDQFVPRKQIWARSARGWVDDIAAIPKTEAEPG